MNKLLLLIGAIGLLTATGCIVPERERPEHVRYERREEVVVAPPEVIVRPPEVIVR